MERIGGQAVDLALGAPAGAGDDGPVITVAGEVVVRESTPARG
jgi:hypothetical protein